MKPIHLKNERRLRRRRHVRQRIRRQSELPRLSVNRTIKHFSAQIIDDANGRTLAAASTTAKALGAELEGKTKSQRAALLGAELARRAKDAGVEAVVFDRGHARYHGRIKAFADAAREGGLKF